MVNWLKDHKSTGFKYGFHINFHINWLINGLINLAFTWFHESWLRGCHETSKLCINQGEFFVARDCWPNDKNAKLNCSAKHKKKSQLFSRKKLCQIVIQILSWCHERSHLSEHIKGWWLDIHHVPTSMTTINSGATATHLLKHPTWPSWFNLPIAWGLQLLAGYREYTGEKVVFTPGNSETPIDKQRWSSCWKASFNWPSCWLAGKLPICLEISYSKWWCFHCHIEHSRFVTSRSRLNWLRKSA